MNTLLGAPEQCTDVGLPAGGRRGRVGGRGRRWLQQGCAWGPLPIGEQSPRWWWCTTYASRGSGLCTATVRPPPKSSPTSPPRVSTTAQQALCLSQVDVAFDDEHTPGTRQNRTPAFEIADVPSQCLSIAERQTSWLERSASHGGKPATWRRVQHYRLGGKHWYQALGNQFLHSSCCGGLSFFRFGSERGGLWASWRTFPYLAVSIDLGPLSVCSL